MANRSWADFERTTAGACSDEPLCNEDASLDRSIFHDDESFDALLIELAAGGMTPMVPLPAPGEVIAGKYRIEAKLGQGGMGAVYRAIHLISGKQVALKWMLSGCSDAHARSRFVREARVAARIDHPNVVDIFDIGQDGDRGLYMVMQLLRGESLGQRLAKGKLGVAETIDLLLPAMRGVAAVHAAGVIHRDLKPDNIFLCESAAGRGEAKVLDFGISAVATHEEGDPTLTRDGALVGTPAYMSPEQIQDPRAVDARTDVYSFGVILYETLTGQQPFRAASHHGLVLAILEGSLQDPRQLRADLPDAVVAVVQRALARRREDRFPDVEALIDALRADDLYRIAKPSRWSVTRIACLAVGVLGTSLAVSFGARWMDDSLVQQTPARRPSLVTSRQSVAPRAPSPSTDHAPASTPTALLVEQAVAQPNRALSLLSTQDASAPEATRGAPHGGARHGTKLSRARMSAAAQAPTVGLPSSPRVAARSGKIAIEDL